MVFLWNDCMQSHIWLLTLKSMARLHASELYSNRPLEASNGFIEFFSNRNHLKSIRPHCTGGAIPPVDTEREMSELRAKMEGMNPDMIFNMDEAALFYQLDPTRSSVK